MRNSSIALVKFVGDLPKTIPSLDPEVMSVIDFVEAYLNVFASNLRNDRVSNSLLETMYVLMSGGVFDGSCAAFLDQIDTLFPLFKKEVYKSKDVKKLMSVIRV